MNFSRVHYELDVIPDKVSGESLYVKTPGLPEKNYVWAPTGVIDIHRPEKWAYVIFVSDHTLLANQGAEYFDATFEIDCGNEMLLTTIYYSQRQYYLQHSQCYAETIQELYGEQIAMKLLERISPSIIKFDVLEREDAKIKSYEIHLHGSSRIYTMAFDGRYSCS